MIFIVMKVVIVFVNIVREIDMLVNTAGQNWW